jgi:hypothetical protein
MSRWVWRVSVAREERVEEGPAFRSMPVQKTLFVGSDEVRMMVRTRGSVERRWKAAIRERPMASVKEFRAEGRSREMMTMGVGETEEAGWWDSLMSGRERVW